MSRASAIRYALAIVLSASASSACRAEESVLDAIFRCNPEAGDAQCGTDENGKPMVCYVGSAQLGGEAFCAKSCDPTHPTDRGFLCTSSGALLERCDPGANAGTCQSPLECYRTDVLFNEGLCMWVPICPYVPGTIELDDGQCGISHSICAGQLLRDLASGSALSAALQTDHLHCVAQPPCSMYGCSGTVLPEICPSEFYGTNFGLPITCAAPCDRFACPPNFACAGSSSPGSPSLCLPGLPGVRCTSSEDCLVGDCLDTGAGFSVCTEPAGCNTDDECLIFGTLPASVCLEGIPGGGGHCVSTIPFSGANCQDSSQCSGELRCGSEACPPRECSQYSPYELNPPHGDCRFSCDPRVGCPAFGGLPHVCLEKVIADELGPSFGGCFPGTFGVPCSRPSECFANLSCETVPPDERSRSQHPKICTISCSEDADCTNEANPWIGGSGYCVPAPDTDPGAVRYCRNGAQPGRPCEKDEHCLSGRCELQENGSRVCGSIDP
jgi:hypothetical protein